MHKYTCPKCGAEFESSTKLRVVECPDCRRLKYNARQRNRDNKAMWKLEELEYQSAYKGCAPTSFMPYENMNVNDPYELLACAIFSRAVNDYYHVLHMIKGESPKDHLVNLALKNELEDYFRTSAPFNIDGDDIMEYIRSRVEREPTKTTHKGGDQSKAVRNKITGEVFPSLTIAAMSEGVSCTTIYQAIRGRGKRKGQWEYCNDKAERGILPHEGKGNA